MKKPKSSPIIRIGTRDSELALWQAKTVEKLLQDNGHETQLIPIKSDGDIVLDKPLYELGITGIFTKTLDVAMIQGKIDIAVHSMKDVPTQLPQNIVQGAVLKRANVADILVHNGRFSSNDIFGTIATSSLRRKAQWLYKYPNYQIDDIRGNVNTRLKKLEASAWNGAIFAAAGLERLNIKPNKFELLDWMIPAPAQGAMLVAVHSDHEYALNAVAELNDVETEICTYIERQFLRTLEGGCTAPVGALATYDEVNDKINFKGNLCSINGKQNLVIEKSVEVAEWKKLGFYCAKEILENGGLEIMNELKS